MSRSPSPIYLERGQFCIRLAETDEEIEQAQNLRHRCFFPDKDPNKRDKDRFDRPADHLLAIDTNKHQIVGTYRFLRDDQAERIGGFYSANEFDLSFLQQLKGNTLELGRSCIDPAYRKSGVATLLWFGCGAYVSAYNIENLFGCASFAGTNADAYAQAFSYLHHFLPPPKSIQVKARTPNTVSTMLLPKQAVDKKQAQDQMPSLVKGYSKMGGWFGQEAAIDEAFDCIDLLLCVTGATAPASYHRRFKRPEFVVEKR